MTARAEEIWVACNLCGSRDSSILFTATRSAKQVVRCRGCGLIYYNPQPSPSQVAALYSSDYYAQEYPDCQAADQIEVAHRRLARIEREAGRGSLLDVGCGLGRFLCVARQRGWQAMGLDVSPAAAQSATATSGVPVLQGDLSRSLPAGMTSFDVLTMWDVVEHLSDPVGSLCRVRDWLRPGGVLVIQTQNANSVASAWMRHGWEQFVEHHLYHFSPRTLRLALEKAGFEQIRIEASDSFPSKDPLPRQDVAPPSAASQKSLRDCLRHVRDLLFMALGYDPFNLMVAIARAPAEGDRSMA